MKWSDLKKTDNGYSISFFNGDARVMFIKYSHHPNNAIKWFENLGKQWTHCNVYNRKTEVFIEQIKK